MLRLAADGEVSREGLFSSDRLLSARAACRHARSFCWKIINYKKNKTQKLSFVCIVIKQFF